MDERHRFDPALDLASAVILRFEHAAGCPEPGVIAGFRREYARLGAAERERFRAIVVDHLVRRRGLAADDARYLLADWFPPDPPDPPR